MRPQERKHLGYFLVTRISIFFVFLLLGTFIHKIRLNSKGISTAKIGFRAFIEFCHPIAEIDHGFGKSLDNLVEQLRKKGLY